MMDDRIERNREEAAALGWTPADFGARTFGADLVAKIEAFQHDRFLDETGIADLPTYRALLGMRQGLRDAEPNRARDEALHELGSVSRYPAGDPRVLRSNLFARRLAWIEHPDAADQVRLAREAVAAGATGIVATKPGLVTRAGLGVPVHALFTLRPGFQPAVCVSVAILARERLGADGVVVEIPRATWIDLVARDEGAPLQEFVAGLPADLPKAVHAEIPAAKDAGAAGRRAWAACRGFDVSLPAVPGEWPGSPAEFAIGQMVSEWSIFGTIRPSFTFPQVVPIEGTTPNEVVRFRAWIANRGIRGEGIRLWRAMLFPAYPEIEAAFWRPLPDKVDRIDFF